MSRRNHLGEVDDDRLVCLALDEDVELVEVTVDQTRSRKTHNHLHQLSVQSGNVRHTVHGTHRARVDVAHDDTVARLVDWRGDRETVVVQDLHECKLLLRSKARHVHPRGRRTLAEVVTLVLDRTERDTSESAGQLPCHHTQQ